MLFFISIFSIIFVLHVLLFYFTKLHCCGAENMDDWYTIFKDKLPMSCCGSYDGVTDYQNCTASEPTVYQKPCYESLSKIVKENASTLSGMAIGIAFLQVCRIFYLIINRPYKEISFMCINI